MNESSNLATPPRRRNWKHTVIGFSVGLGTYFLVAYVLMPALWKRYERRHPALDDLPGITETGDKHPGDPINCRSDRLRRRREDDHEGCRLVSRRQARPPE